MRKIILMVSVLLSALFQLQSQAGSLAEVQTTGYNRDYFKAIKNADLKTVKKILDSGLEVDHQDYKKTTGLMRAASFGHTTIVKLLLDRGASVNLRDKEGDTPLKHAAWSDKPEIIDLLVAKGADLEAKNKLGTTPIWSAVITGRTDMVKSLLRHGANPDTPNQYGMSAIRFARSRDEWALVKLLEEANAKDF